jgi:hypothetical protein
MAAAVALVELPLSLATLKIATLPRTRATLAAGTVDVARLSIGITSGS